MYTMGYLSSSHKKGNSAVTTAIKFKSLIHFALTDFEGITSNKMTKTKTV